MNTKHTPGPWNCFKRIAAGTIQTIQSSAGSIAKTCVEFDAETQEANARLISSAPELLEALEEAVDWEGHIDKSRDAWWVAKARAAIAKAKGQQ